MDEESVNYEIDGSLFFILDHIYKAIDEEKKEIYDVILSELKPKIQTYLDENFRETFDWTLKGNNIDAETFRKYCLKESRSLIDKYYNNYKTLEKFQNLELELRVAHSTFFNIYESVKLFNEVGNSSNFSAEVFRDTSREYKNTNLLDSERFIRFNEDIEVMIENHNESISSLLKFMENDMSYNVSDIIKSESVETSSEDLREDIEFCTKSLKSIGEYGDGVTIMRNEELLVEPLVNLATLVNLKLYGLNGVERSGVSINKKEDSIHKRLWELNSLGIEKQYIDDAITALGYEVKVSKIPFLKQKIKLVKI